MMRKMEMGMGRVSLCVCVVVWVNAWGGKGLALWQVEGEDDNHGPTQFEKAFLCVVVCVGVRSYVECVRITFGGEAGAVNGIGNGIGDELERDRP